MRQALLYTILVLLTSNVRALSFDNMPTSLEINEIPGCIGCARVKSGDQLIGSLIRLGARGGHTGRRLYFDFFDAIGQKTISFKLMHFYFEGTDPGDINEHRFAVLNAEGDVVGQYHYFTSSGRPIYFTFDSIDGTTQAMTGSYHGLTQLTIYFKDTTDVMMELQYPLFSWKRNLSTTFINVPLLSISKIDPNVLAAILAFQSLTQLRPLSDYLDLSLFR